MSAQCRVIKGDCATTNKHSVKHTYVYGYGDKDDDGVGDQQRVC